MKRAEGKIVEVKPGKMQAKVELFAREDSDGKPMVTDWLQILFTGPDIEYSYRKDDYVALIMDDHFDDGWIVGRLYDDKASLDSTEKKSAWKFKDNTAVFEFDEQQKELTLQIGEAVEIKITQTGIEINGGKLAGLPAQGVVHAMSPCPVFGTCHLQPSVTIKVSQ